MGRTSQGFAIPSLALCVLIIAHFLLFVKRIFEFFRFFYRLNLQGYFNLIRFLCPLDNYYYTTFLKKVNTFLKNIFLTIAARANGRRYVDQITSPVSSFTIEIVLPS